MLWLVREAYRARYKLGEVSNHPKETSHFFLTFRGLALLDSLCFLGCRFEAFCAKSVTIESNLRSAKFTLGLFKHDSIIFSPLEYCLQCDIVFFPIFCSLWLRHVGMSPNILVITPANRSWDALEQIPAALVENYAMECGTFPQI